ncbi:MAG: hypothetical protein F4Z81_04895 [Gemmatimonadetes bacterium]|nr:hypothetical protein [Gemmatimonadota bacterium]MYB60382.1 hypothetical protein [Gemmatimonadota bacterium]
MALTEGKTVNGKKDGYWITYYANGNKRSEGNYRMGVKDGNWIQYFSNGNKKSEGRFKNGLNEGWYTCWHENGTKQWEGDYGPHVGKSYDGKKEGRWFCYSAKDGETVWRTIEYKHGTRTRPDVHPLGPCLMCGDPIHDPDTDLCPACNRP